MASKRKQSKSKAASSPSARGGSGSPMNVDLLEQIVKLMSANDLNTVDVRDGDKRVILRRGAAVQYAAAPMAAPQMMAPTPASQGGSGGGGGASPAPAPASAEPSGVPIKSPMVGTFYASPKPGEKAFVTVGSRVVKDETDICIIEAMKTFNTLKADVTGEIVKVVASDGESVQYDQPLFLVKPA